MGIIENEIGMLMLKRERFDKLKAGDAVKVPPYGKKVRIIEKYPYHFVAKAKNGYKTCFSVGDYIVALGLSGRSVARED